MAASEQVFVLKNRGSRVIKLDTAYFKCNRNTKFSLNSFSSLLKKWSFLWVDREEAKQQIKIALKETFCQLHWPFCIGFQSAKYSYYGCTCCASQISSGDKTWWLHLLCHMVSWGTFAFSYIYIKAQQQRKHHLKMYPFCCLLMRMHILNRNRILTLEWPTMTICLEISVMQIRHSSFPPTRCVISMEATIRNTYEKRYSKSICCTSHRMRQLASAKNSPDSFWLIDWRCNIFNVIKCLRLSIFNLDNWL